MIFLRETRNCQRRKLKKYLQKLNWKIFDEMTSNLEIPKHAREQMEERGITEKQIISTIVSGEKFKDLKYPEPNCFVYKRPIKGVHYSVAVKTRSKLQQENRVFNLSDF
jgi:hypothetical protein